MHIPTQFLENDVVHSLNFVKNLEEIFPEM